MLSELELAKIKLDLMMRHINRQKRLIKKLKSRITILTTKSKTT